MQAIKVFAANILQIKQSMKSLILVMDYDYILCYDYEKEMKIGQLNDLTDEGGISSIAICEYGD